MKDLHINPATNKNKVNVYVCMYVHITCEIPLLRGTWRLDRMLILILHQYVFPTSIRQISEHDQFWYDSHSSPSIFTVYQYICRYGYICTYIFAFKLCQNPSILLLDKQELRTLSLILCNNAYLSLEWKLFWLLSDLCQESTDLCNSA